jgi:hypothetical protein
LGSRSPRSPRLRRSRTGPAQPDTRDAALASIEANARQDLRSPDTRPGAEDRGPFSAPEVTVVKLQQPSPSAAGGVDWGDAGSEPGPCSP